MLRQPAWRMSVEPEIGNTDKVDAGSVVAERIREFLQRIRTHRKDNASRVGSLRICVHDEVSFHTGLGSGTQLGLALSAAIELMIHHRMPEDPFQLAQLAARAERSAVGTIGFARGGFLVDHGEAQTGELHRRVDRIAFPDDWRFLLVHPGNSQGLSGEQERRFFGQRIHMPPSLIDSIGHQVLEEIVPAVRDRQFATFAASLEHYGQVVGRFYAAEQGGVFAHPAMTKLAEYLSARGVSGMTQSSWGPLISIPASSQQHAEEIRELIPESIDDDRLNVSVSEPLNTGATMRTIVDDAAGRGLV